MAEVAAALDACREVAYRTEGDRVALVNKVVSRVYDGFFYVQDEDRSSGVRVVSSRQFDPGDLVSVQGTVCSAGGAKAICGYSAFPTAEGRSMSQRMAPTFLLRAASPP